jgi:hypothetical protein
MMIFLKKIVLFSRVQFLKLEQALQIVCEVEKALVN